MKSRAAFIGIIIIVNSCFWGLAMILCSNALKGTGGYQEIQNILAGFSAASLIVVGGGLAAFAAQTRKPK